MNASFFPPFNAALNATSGCLIVFGLFLIVKKARTAHAVVMSLAMLTSTIFLGSYLYYHYHHGSTAFVHDGWIRPVYFTILISHVILAVLVVPLSLVTIFYAVKKKMDRHVKIARVLFPIWLYVSVTGVVIYWMLYQMS